MRERGVNGSCYTCSLLFASTSRNSPPPLFPRRSKGQAQHTEVSSAVRSYSIAAGLGNGFAHHRLAYMNMRGLGVQRNCEHAVQYFRAVAEKVSGVLQCCNEILRRRASQTRYF